MKTASVLRHIVIGVLLCLPPGKAHVLMHDKPVGPNVPAREAIGGSISKAKPMPAPVAFDVPDTAPGGFAGGLKMGSGYSSGQDSQVNQHLLTISCGQGGIYEQAVVTTVAGFSSRESQTSTRRHPSEAPVVYVRTGSIHLNEVVMPQSQERSPAT